MKGIRTDYRRNTRESIRDIDDGWHDGFNSRRKAKYAARRWIAINVKFEFKLFRGESRWPGDTKKMSLGEATRENKSFWRQAFNRDEDQPKLWSYRAIDQEKVTNVHKAVCTYWTEREIIDHDEFMDAVTRIARKNGGIVD